MTRSPSPPSSGRATGREAHVFGGYLLRRVALAVGVLWAGYTVSYVVLFLLPGDAVETMASGGLDGQPLDPSQLAELRARYGLDQPLIVQYGQALGKALHGDLGVSVQNGEDVTRTIASALPSTLGLAATALVLAVVLGVLLALVATYTNARWLRQALLSLPALAVSLPVFWVGLTLVQVFSFGLGWFPAVGARGVQALVLPTITLALPLGAQVAQVLAASLDRTLDEPYVVTARAKGVGRVAIHLGHALQNAAAPALTVAGLLVGQLLAGTVVVETVFTRPGIGRLTVDAVSIQDIPLVQGIVVFASLVYVVANLVVDLIYPLLDPRIAQGVAS